MQDGIYLLTRQGGPLAPSHSPSAPIELSPQLAMAKLVGNTCAVAFLVILDEQINKLGVQVLLTLDCANSQLVIALQKKFRIGFTERTVERERVSDSN